MSENASVPFMEHPFHQIKVEPVSDRVKSRIRNGHSVRVKPTEGEGLNLIVHSHRLGKMTKCMKSGKGTQIQLHPHEIEANKSIEGEGIFGKKADKFMKKHHIKKFAYAVGKVAKPFAQEAVSALGTAVDAYAPGVGSMAAQHINGYMDEPEKYQKMIRDGVKELKGKPTGNYKAQALDMMADRMKNGNMGGDTIGHLDRASIGKAMSDRASAEIAKRLEASRSAGGALMRMTNNMPRQKSSLPTQQDYHGYSGMGGYGLYAGRGLGVGLYGCGMPRQREFHSVGGRHSLMGQGVPALASQPFGVNYQFRAQLPPAYQHLHS